MYKADTTLIGCRSKTAHIAHYTSAQIEQERLAVGSCREQLPPNIAARIDIFILFARFDADKRGSKQERHFFEQYGQTILLHSRIGQNDELAV